MVLPVSSVLIFSKETKILKRPMSNMTLIIMGSVFKRENKDF